MKPTIAVLGSYLYSEEGRTMVHICSVLEKSGFTAAPYSWTPIQHQGTPWDHRVRYLPAAALDFIDDPFDQPRFLGAIHLSPNPTYVINLYNMGVVMERQIVIVPPGSHAEAWRETGLDTARLVTPSSGVMARLLSAGFPVKRTLFSDFVPTLPAARSDRVSLGILTKNFNRDRLAWKFLEALVATGNNDLPISVLQSRKTVSKSTSPRQRKILDSLPHCTLMIRPGHDLFQKWLGSHSLTLFTQHSCAYGTDLALAMQSGSLVVARDDDVYRGLLEADASPLSTGCILKGETDVTTIIEPLLSTALRPRVFSPRGTPFVGYCYRWVHQLLTEER